jgi:hypothetical protein
VNITRSVLVFAALVISLSLSPQACAADNASECLEKGIFKQISCLSDLAASKGRASVCDAAEHEGVKYQCYAVAAEKLGDWKACFEIPAKSREHVELRDVCISDVADKTADSDLCDKIETSNFKDSCYLKVKNKTGDSALCSRISDTGIKSMCTGEPVMVE